MTRRWTLCILTALLISAWSVVLPSRALAHPVAIGGVVVDVVPGKVLVRFRSSIEEICVAHNLRVDAKTDAYSIATLSKAYAEHADYILEHLVVTSGNSALTGKLVKFAAEGGVKELGYLETQSNFVVYDFEFPLPAGNEKKLAGAVFLKHTMLEGFDFAPGNPWEVVYLLRIRAAKDAKTPYEMTLFKRETPVIFDVEKAAFIEGAVPPGKMPLEPGSGINPDSLAPGRDLSAENGGGTATPANVEPVETHIDVWRTFKEYCSHGIHHILEGYDHLLFISALTLAVLSFWDLIKVVTMFTLAHTLTLTLSVLDVIRLPSSVVEPMIAASIVFVAVQNIFWPRGSRGKLRLAAAFGFGLFHGLGFAGGLLETMEGLPSIGIGTSLAGFSIGVEIGHQMIVIPLFIALALGRKYIDEPRAKVEPEDAPPPGERVFSRAAMKYGSFMISIAGLYYLVYALMGGE